MDELIPDPELPKKPTGPTGVEYAGFWRRFNAYGIDATILWIVCIILQYFFFPDPAPTSQGVDDMQQLTDLMDMAQNGLPPAMLQQLQGNLMNESFGGSILGADTVLMIVLSAIYNILFVIGPWQATPGKHWLKCRIINADGTALTLLQSALRHAMTALSAVAWMVPCITVFFTREKLAPHDMICQTRVIMRPH